MKVSNEGFKQVLRRFPSGVTVVTVKNGTEVHGITVSAFISVSIDPELILVSIGKQA
ncbi:MAG TPA: flavin reductase, partial [Trueperaceae bacterium]|nr:flavin reductase [Trueperaceae bacterium]